MNFVRPGKEVVQVDEVKKHLTKAEEETKLARKWSRQAVILSVTALIINVLRVILKIIGVL